MIKDDGYIYINVLILLIIILLLLINFLSIQVNTRRLVVGKLNGIKAYNSSEAKILQVLNEKKYLYRELIPFIISSFENNFYYEKTFKIDRSDLINNDNQQGVKISFDHMYDRRVWPKELYIKSTGTEREYKSSLVASVNIFNDIFIEEKGLIDREEKDLVHHMNEFFVDFNEAEKSSYGSDKDALNIEDYSSQMFELFRDENKELILIKDSEKYIELEANKIKLLSMNKNGANIYIENYKNIYDLINLTGILYVEGNLIIKNNFDFQGILIVKNGNIYVDEGVNFKCSGLIINDGKNSLRNRANISYEYNSDVLKKQIIYLPGSIRPKIKIIREE